MLTKNKFEINLRYFLIILFFNICALKANVYQSEIDFQLKNLSKEKQIQLLADTAKITQNIEKKFYYAKYLAKLSDKYSLPQYKAQAFLRIGNYYQYQGNYDSSAYYYTQSIKFAELAKDTAQIITSLIYHSLNMNILRDYKSMLKNNFRAYYLSAASKDTYQMATSAFNIAFAYSGLDDYKASHRYLDTSKKYLSALKNQYDNKVKYAWGIYYFYLGQTFSYEKKYCESIYNLSLSKRINTEINNTQMDKAILATLAKAHLETLHYDDARKYAEQTLEFDDINDEYKVFALEVLTDYYKHFNDYNTESKYLRLLLKTKDSVRANDSRLINAAFEVKTAEQREMQAKTLQKSNNRNLLIITSIIILGFIIITIIFYSRYKIKKKLSIELEKSNSSKSRLFSIISHDMMNPVASLKQSLDLINNKYDNISEDHKRIFIEKMTVNSNNLYRLLSNLLAWSRINLNSLKLRIEPVNINELVNSELLQFDYQIKNKSIIVEFNSTVKNLINLDPNILSVVFRNILSNAVKFTDIGKIIIIDTYCESNRFILKVSNEGAPISDSSKEQLLNRHSIVSSSGTDNEKGSGLGLGICFELINLHKGNLYIKNDTITVIEIELPINEGD